MALITPFDRAAPAVWQVLFYDTDHAGKVNAYQALLPITAAVMGLAWHRLIVSVDRVTRISRPTVRSSSSHCPRCHRMPT